MLFVYNEKKKEYSVNETNTILILIYLYLPSEPANAEIGA